MRAITNAAAAVIPVAVLFGCTLFAQSYSALYAPASSNLQQYVCVDVATGSVVPGAQWWIDFQNTGYYVGKNYHNHNLIVPYPPRANYSPNSGNADGDGFFSFSLFRSDFLSTSDGPRS